MFPVCLNKKVHKTIWKSVVLKYVARYSVIRANLSHINFKGSARRLLVQRASSRQVLLIEIKAHVVITCTNGVSPNHLPVIVASDRPWTTLLTRAHNKIWRRTESAPQSKRRQSHGWNRQWLQHSQNNRQKYTCLLRCASLWALANASCSDGDKLSKRKLRVVIETPAFSFRLSNSSTNDDTASRPLYNTQVRCHINVI